MKPEERPIPRFLAEPPREGPPEGAWRTRLEREFLEACRQIEDPPEDLGDPTEVLWYPGRGWHGYTYIPATAPTSGGYELFGYVRVLTPAEDEEGEPTEISAAADATEETAERNPEWALDICDEVIGSWRGQEGAVAAITLVWGRPLVAFAPPGTATADLGGTTVDQCELVEGRFTLIAPDDYQGELLQIRLHGQDGREMAAESLYDPEEEQEAED